MGGIRQWIELGIALKELRSEDSTLAEKLNRLTDLMIEGHLEPKIFEIKKTEIVMRRREIAHLLEDNVMADDQFKDALCKVIGLAAKSYDLFESSKTDEKRGLLGFVFLNLKLEGPTLRYDLRKPFDHLAKLPNNPEWRAGQDESANWELSLPISPTRSKSSTIPVKEPAP